MNKQTSQVKTLVSCIFSANTFWHIIAIIYACILFSLNFIRIFDNNFWGDESFSINIAMMSAKDMISITAGDVHPPLYYLIVMVAYRLLGNHGWVYHLVSLIPYTICIVFTLTVLWNKFGKCASFLMLTFISVMGTAITFNVQVRMYSWAFLFVLLAFYCLYMILEDSKPKYICLFVVMSLCAAYTHYYAMMSVAFLYLILLILTLFRKFPIRKLVITYISTIIGYLPWLFVMITTFKRTSESFWMTYIPGFMESLTFYFRTDYPPYEVNIFKFMAIALIVMFIYDCNIVSYHDDNGNFKISVNRPHIVISDCMIWLVSGLAAGVGTIILGELISHLIRPAFMVRYIYPVTGVMWLVLCVLVSRLKITKHIAFIVIMASTLIICIPHYIEEYRMDKLADERCHEAVNYINSAISSDDIIITNGTHLEWSIIPYYFPNIECHLADVTQYQYLGDHQYWIIKTEDLDIHTMLSTNSLVTNVTELYHDGEIGDNPVHFYKVKTNK